MSDTPVAFWLQIERFEAKAVLMSRAGVIFIVTLCTVALVATTHRAFSLTVAPAVPHIAQTAQAPGSPADGTPQQEQRSPANMDEPKEPSPPSDIYGNEVSDAVARYS